MGEKGRPIAALSRPSAEVIVHKAITRWLPILYFLISSSFFLRTYDSAQIKITLLQMGGLGLLTLWLCRLALAGRAAFSREDLVCLSPFLAYLGIGIFSYLHAAYGMVSTDFFLRHMFYMIVALIVIYELNEAAVARLFFWLIAAAWVAIGYGTLQIVDYSLFPAGIGNGIDPFIWRGAFGSRVFSTYGNPNFYGDFLVIIFPILGSQFLKTRSWSLVPLMLMLLVNLAATGTKGAWLGFAIVCVLAGTVALTYFREQTRRFRKIVLSIAATAALALIGYTARDLSTRIVSVNFRLFTWEATWEMIRTHPFIGSGVGAFPPLYPAFRRPPIFHIEGKHNTETDHAEDEYLEEFLDHGIIGFGVFLWLIFSTLVIGFRSLGQLMNTQSVKDGRPPPRAYDLAGLLVAVCGMLGHNFFDVSLRFVSSGVYLGLLLGLIVNVARGRALYELHPRGEPAAPSPASETAVSAWKMASEFLIWPARVAAIGGFVYVLFLLHWKDYYHQVGFGGISGEFAFLFGPFARIAPNSGGEQIQWLMSWGIFWGCMLGLGGVLARVCLLSSTPIVPLIVLASLNPLYLFWGYFKADIHHNLAIYLSKNRQWDAAIEHYLIVDKLNPDFVMAKYFLGNVYNDRFTMTKVYNPLWGDKNEVEMDDYERALYWYNEVRRLSPNYVQMHHQVGNLHFRRARWAMDNHRPPEEVEKYLTLALNRYRLYQAIDPVYPPNYYQMAQVYALRHQYKEALAVYDEFFKAEQCAVDPTLLKNDFLRRTILSYQPYEGQDGVWTHRHAPAEGHEAAEVYANIADLHYFLEQIAAAENFYKKALAADSGFGHAKTNLQILYAKAQSLGRLRKVPPPAQSPTPGDLPYTGYAVTPDP